MINERYGYFVLSVQHQRQLKRHRRTPHDSHQTFYECSEQLLWSDASNVQKIGDTRHIKLRRQKSAHWHIYAHVPHPHRGSMNSIVRKAVHATWTAKADWDIIEVLLLYSNYQLGFYYISNNDFGGHTTLQRAPFDRIMCHPQLCPKKTTSSIYFMHMRAHTPNACNQKWYPNNYCTVETSFILLLLLNESQILTCSTQ